MRPEKESGMGRPGNNLRIACGVAVLLAAFAVQCVLSMSRESATSDEVPHLAAGYSYLKLGDYRLNYEHPPLLKLVAGLPLLALDLGLDRDDPSWKRADEWAFGEKFINDNRTPARTIVFWGRLPMVALGVLLGLVVFVWTREIYGAGAGLVALFLVAFCPNLLANAPLVTFDTGNALFTILALYTFYHFLLRPRPREVTLAGVALGLALSSKMTAFTVLPIYAVLAIVALVRREGAGLTVRRMIGSCALILVAAALVVVLAYGVTSVHYYVDGLRYFLRDVGQGGRPAFLFGRYSLHGWWYYFLAAILIKTPLPTLVLVGTTLVVLAARRKLAFAEYCLLVPVAFFLVVASASRLQLGIRYILQIYPLLYIVVGGTIAGMVGRAWCARAPWRKLAAGLVVALLVWCCVGTLHVFPHYLAYFNEAVGGPKNGYRYLIDSNLDWGQDLPALERFLAERGRPEVILSYFGTAAPRTYGITYQDFYSYNLSGRVEEHINSAAPRQEVLVISANSLQCLYYPNKHTYDWLKKKRPLARPGYSLFVYDVTRDAETHARLGAMYLSGNLVAKARREFERVLSIDPQNAQARRYLESMSTR
jgi:hypothetical protein